MVKTPNKKPTKHAVVPKKERIIKLSQVEDFEIELMDWFELLEASMGKRLP